MMNDWEANRSAKRTRLTTCESGIQSVVGAMDAVKEMSMEIDMNFSDHLSSYDVLTMSSSTSFSCSSPYRTPHSNSPQRLSELSESWVWTNPSLIPALNQIDPSYEEINDKEDEGYYQIQQDNSDSWETLKKVTEERTYRDVEAASSRDNPIMAYQLQLANMRMAKDTTCRDNYGSTNGFDEEMHAIHDEKNIPNSSQDIAWEPINLDHGRSFAVRSEHEIIPGTSGTPFDYQFPSSDAHSLAGRLETTYNLSSGEVADGDRQTFTVVPSQTLTIPLMPLPSLGDPFRTPVKTESPESSCLSDSPIVDIALRASSYQCQGRSPSPSAVAARSATWGSCQVKASPRQSPEFQSRRIKKDIVKKKRMVKGTHGSYLCEVPPEPTKKYQCRRYCENDLPCLKSFQRQEHRNRHEDIHDGTRDHECPKCGRPFGRKDNWKQHIQKTHLLRASNERNARITWEELVKLGISHEFLPTKKRKRSRR